MTKDNFKKMETKLKEYAVWIALLGVLLGGGGVCGAIKESQSYAKREDVKRMIKEMTPSRETSERIIRIETKVDNLKEDVLWIKQQINANNKK